MTVQAIQTRYAGRHFRSRVEARWAVFFDTLSIPWQYEKEGVVLPSGPYLPDFWLPSIDSWFEVKGAPPDDRAQNLARDLAEATGNRVFIAFGDLPYGTPGHSEWQDIYLYDNGCDEDYMWCSCLQCGKFGIEYMGRGDRICRHHDNDDGYSAHHHIIQYAYALALSYRFDGRALTGHVDIASLIERR